MTRTAPGRGRCEEAAEQEPPMSPTSIRCFTPALLWASGEKRHRPKKALPGVPAAYPADTSSSSSAGRSSLDRGAVEGHLGWVVPGKRKGKKRLKKGTASASGLPSLLPLPAGRGKVHPGKKNKKTKAKKGGKKITGCRTGPKAAHGSQESATNSSAEAQDCTPATDLAARHDASASEGAALAPEEVAATGPEDGTLAYEPVVEGGPQHPGGEDSGDELAETKTVEGTNLAPGHMQAAAVAAAPAAATVDPAENEKDAGGDCSEGASPVAAAASLAATLQESSPQPAQGEATKLKRRAKVTEIEEVQDISSDCSTSLASGSIDLRGDAPAGELAGADRLSGWPGATTVRWQGVDESARELQHTSSWTSSEMSARSSSYGGAPGRTLRRQWTDRSQLSQMRLEVQEGERMTETELFATLKNMPCLTSLRLRSRGLVHASPDFLHKLTQLCPMLTHLHMANVHGQNQLEAVDAPDVSSLVFHGREVPLWIASLSGLRHLELHGCWEFPHWLGACLPHLESLKMEAPCVAKFPASMARLPSLKTLTLHLFNQDRLPGGLSAMAALKRLNVAAPNLKSEDGLSEMCGLRDLEQLKLQVGPGLTSLPEDMASLAKLHSFTLECSGRDELTASRMELPGGFWALPSLKRLRLQGLSAEETLSGLGGLRTLEALSLRRCNLRKLPQSLCSMRHLSVLKIDDCRNLKDLPEGLGRLSSLRTLHLFGLQIRGLPPTADQLTALTQLRIRSCRNIPPCDAQGEIVW